MTSKSATVLVMLVVAIVAFCLASCFAAMTGPISIPIGLDSGNNTTDNLSTVPVDNSYDDSDYQDYYDYSESSSSNSYVETTTDDSNSGTPSQEDPQPATSDGSQEPSNVETTSG